MLALNRGRSWSALAVAFRVGGGDLDLDRELDASRMFFNRVSCACESEPSCGFARPSELSSSDRLAVSSSLLLSSSPPPKTRPVLTVVSAWPKLVINKTLFFSLFLLLADDDEFADLGEREDER